MKTNEQQIDPSVILSIVQNTDKVKPGKEFRDIAPFIHHSKKALKIVGHWGNLSQVYCETLVEKYNDNFPFEIEKAIINLKLKPNNLIYYLSWAAHTWSDEAAMLMKKDGQNWNAYDACIRNTLSPQDALIFLADKKEVKSSEAQQKILFGLLECFKKKGYIKEVDGILMITDLGRQKARALFLSYNRHLSYIGL